MILADIDLGDILWSLLVFYFMVIYFIALFSVISDLFRSRDLSGIAKAGWTLFILVLPVLSMFIYLIVRGDSMADRAFEKRQQADAQVREYVRDVAPSSSADEIAKAKQLLDSGAINQAEFDQLKQNALAV